jgi:tRNA U34 5-methylaminomethyl-2-thiouridine-forming methyltransferase MnmC
MTHTSLEILERYRDICVQRYNRLYDGNEAIHFNIENVRPSVWIGRAKALISVIRHEYRKDAWVAM